jgi:hypothetical protein
MTAIPMTKSNLQNVERAFCAVGPIVPVEHVREALAVALGKPDYATLLAAIEKQDARDPEIVVLDDDLFKRHMEQLCGESWRRWHGFEGLFIEGGISTVPQSARLLQLTSARKRAWRNMMVSAINEGLRRKLFSFRPGDNRWLGHDEPYIYSFLFPGDIQAMACVKNAGDDELSVHVALWPTKRAGEFLACRNGGFLVGEAYAAGWLERRKGAWLQA